MPSEMSHAVEQGVKAAYFTSLDPPNLQKWLSFLLSQDCPGLLDYGLQPLQQLHFGDGAALGELGRAVPIIWYTTQAGHQPLPHVAAQV
jgi:hypothetical protein